MACSTKDKTEDNRWGNSNPRRAKNEEEGDNLFLTIRYKLEHSRQFYLIRPKPNILRARPYPTKKDEKSSMIDSIT
jgi:hypothetical protein